MKEKFKGKRTVRTFAKINDVASALLNSPFSTKFDEQYLSFSSLIMTAFMFEAFMNHIGNQIVPIWEEIEKSLSPLQKLALVHDRLGIDRPDYGKRPFQSLRELINFRNKVAHGKDETVEAEWKSHPDIDESAKYLASTIDKYSTNENTKRTLEDVREIVCAIWVTAGNSGSPFALAATRESWQIF